RFDLTGAECGQSEFFALFLDGSDLHAFTTQLRREHLLVLGHALARNFLSSSVLACKCTNRHGVLPRFETLQALCYLRPCAWPCACPERDSRLAPRLIISLSSSGFDERCRAVSIVICFWKYSVAKAWLNVCIPYLSCPACIAE